jgi:hypothetical protein
MELFDIEKKISLFDSESYIKYKNLIQKYDISFLKYNKNGLIYINSMYVKPPIIKNVFEEIKESTLKKTELSKNYFDLYNDILYSSTPHKLEKEYNNISIELSNIDIKLDRLHQYYEIINKIKYDNIIGITKKTINILSAKRATLINSGVIDKKTSSKLVKLYLEIKKNTEKLLEDNKNIDHIDYYIVSLPEFNVKNNNKKIEEEPIKKIKETEPIKKIKEKLPIKKSKENVLVSSNENKKVSSKELVSIKNNVKLLLAEKFKFKSKEECLSQKRTQPYYMSKPELIDEIENNEEIKSLLPSKYSKLSKEKICDYLFF